ncbi:MAG: ROK family protein [Candidatus Melainabacteria bacterium]|nr:ROK family protein [Candidatus Melainabacteria bacterium]
MITKKASSKSDKDKSKKHTATNSRNGKGKSTAKTDKKVQTSVNRKDSKAKRVKAKSNKTKTSKGAPSDKTASPDLLRVLAIDIGGTKVKMLVNGEMEPIKALTGTEFTPLKLLEVVNTLPPHWKFDAVTIGYPGLVGANGPLAEPGNLGPGWVGFDFAGAFQKPVKILNDAAMQAVGSYEGGRMLFLGLGTGLGTTMIVDHVILAVELSRLRWTSRKTMGELLSKRSIKKLGIQKWRTAVGEIVHALMSAFVADYVVVGGGNAKLLNELPAGVRVGHNQTAFRGGYRVWGVDNTSSEDLELHGSWKIL